MVGLIVAPQHECCCRGEVSVGEAQQAAWEDRPPSFVPTVGGQINRLFGCCACDSHSARTESCCPDFMRCCPGCRSN